jgi:hypothetical protein
VNGEHTDSGKNPGKSEGQSQREIRACPTCGTVTYKAFDVDLRMPVTLKVINERYVGDESARLRFLREARAAAKVRHTNVASVFYLVDAPASTFTQWSLWKARRWRVSSR